jgi:hypothetical protein
VGFFDPADEKVRKKLPSKDQLRVSMLYDLVEGYGEQLSFHHRREVKFVVFAMWLQHESSRRRAILNHLSMSELGGFLSQSQRIGAHFTREQAAILDETIRFTKADLTAFHPDDEESE